MDEPGESGRLQSPGGPGQQRRVFISYASHDAALAQKVCSALEEAGFLCWIAPRNVIPGTMYAGGIVRAIDESKVLVLILSEQAVASAHVGKELERATSKRHPIIALRIDAAPLTPDFEYFLNASQWIEGGGSDDAIAQLVSAVGQHLAPGTATSPTNANQASAVRLKAATTRQLWLIAGAIVAVALAGAYFLVDKAWRSKHETTATAVIGDKSIAVLPFTDMSEKKDQEYFADGMAEEILDLLVQIPSLKVIGRTSSFQFKGKSEDLRAIGTTLHATYLLEGSVRKAADRVRVTAQLIDTRDGTHVWSGTFDREFGEILKLQHEIAMQIARALQVTVGKEGLQAQGKLSSAESYTLYLRGRLAMDREDEAGIQEAQTDFERALQLDPSFTSAADELAIAFVGQVAEQYVPSEIGWQRVKEAADRALMLDAHSASAHVALALRHAFYEFDFNAADAELAEAQKYHPQDARTLGALARMAFVHGRYDDALRLVNTSLAVDPLSPLMLQLQGFIHYYAGRFSAAEASIRRCIEISPTFDGNHYLLGQILLDQGHPDAALKEMQLELDVGGRDAGSAMVYHAMGRRMESDRALAELTRQLAAIWPTGIADVYAFRGQIDASFQWLDKAYAQRNMSLQFVKGSPLLRNLRGDPRYEAFLKKMNLVD
jgi:TolB-like protein/tetratricopeptide (TPR) repeat protein